MAIVIQIMIAEIPAIHQLNLLSVACLITVEVQTAIVVVVVVITVLPGHSVLKEVRRHLPGVTLLHLLRVAAVEVAVPEGVLQEEAAARAVVDAAVNIDT